MFEILKKKSEIKKLEGKYQKLLKEAYILSTSNRRLSDSKTTEADEILKQIEQLEKRNLA